MVLPREVRVAFGIEGGSELVCRVVGSRIILEHFDVERIKDAFQGLEEMVPSLDLDVVEVAGEDKYIDREYVLRKLGFRRDR